MGFIKEPKGVDFIINGESLTDKDKKEISKFIKDYKVSTAKLRKGKTSDNKLKQTNA